jgi:hypothetical protein
LWLIPIRRKGFLRYRFRLIRLARLSPIEDLRFRFSGYIQGLSKKGPVIIPVPFFYSDLAEAIPPFTLSTFIV